VGKIKIGFKKNKLLHLKEVGTIPCRWISTFINKYVFYINEKIYESFTIK